MANQVHVGKDGLIHNVYIGDQNYDTVKAVYDKTVTMASERRAQGKMVLLLVDIGRIRKQNSGSRKASFEALNSDEYDRIAIFGQNVFLRTLANMIIRVSRHRQKVRSFRTEAEARQWLSKWL